MTSRRNVLKALGVGLLAPSILFAGPIRPKRSRWELIFGNHPIAQAGARPDPKSWSNNTITAAWIGHATVLINFFGTWILTDPIFSERTGINIAGLFTVGPKRLVEPALPFEELPPIDILLLSHAHMDHMDLPTLKRMQRNIPTVLAKNTSDVISRLEWTKTTELDWGETTTIAGVTIEALRVKHFGWRFPWEDDRSRGTWTGRSFNSYLISRNNHHIVFGGDTAYHEYFKQLGSRNIPIDLAILPIGAYDPWIYAHANPEQSAAMAVHMNAKAILPVHWGTFVLSDEPTQEPIERLKTALGQHPPSLALEQIGETWSLAAVQERKAVSRAPA